MTTTKDEAIKTLREMLSLAVGQNECDMMLTGDECRKARKVLEITSHIAPDAAAIQAEGDGLDESKAMAQFRANLGIKYGPAIAPEASELPPMPARVCVIPGVYAYTDPQMEAYARAAIAMHQYATKPAASEAVDVPYGWVLDAQGMATFERGANNPWKFHARAVPVFLAAPAAPTDAKPDQNEFERQAAHQGARNFTLALGMKCANGWFPATYECPETELAWRVWANKSLKSSPQAPKTEGSKP